MDYSLLTSRFHREKWITFLYDLFHENIVFPSHQQTIRTPDSSLAKKVFVLGTLTTSDKQQLIVYEVLLQDHVLIGRNKVGIRNLLLSDWRGRGCKGALLICHSDTDEAVRLSYIMESEVIQENRLVVSSTDVKRYTFLLGPNQRVRTAQERFDLLAQSPQTLQDLTDAFSVESLNKEFFTRYKEQYGVFVRAICEDARMYEGFHRDEKAIRDYVKKFLGRIVFLHFLQRKGWLGVPLTDTFASETGDKDFLWHLYERSGEALKDDFLDRVLEPFFTNALNTHRLNDEYVLPSDGTRVKVPYLNGGLFERDVDDEVPTKFPRKLFENLLTFFKEYNFTIDENAPDDVEIGVDPEMLGHIFENLLEDNKDKGAFYTPKEVVQFMCQQVISNYLQGCTDAEHHEAVQQFVLTHDGTALSVSLKTTLDEALQTVTICDPAIGSGAFPMGLLKEVSACREVLEPERASMDIKRSVVEKSIYGVDIEKGAVDIARLRFWLAIIVDAQVPEPLPNLDFKIMQGDSLVEKYKGVDLAPVGGEAKELTFVDNLPKTLFTEALIHYFRCNDHKEKSELYGKIKNYVQQFLVANGVDLSEAPTDVVQNHDFFLWHTWFGETFTNGKDGFDIVIANPPYINFSKHKTLSAKYQSEAFQTYDSNGDIYCLFYEKAVNILRPNGVLCYITSDKWLRAGYGKKLRDFLGTHVGVKVLRNMGGGVFENATVDTSILVGVKGGTHALPLPTDGSAWVLLSPIEQAIKSKVEAKGVPLKDWKDLRINRGILTGCNEAFIISTAVRDGILAACGSSEERTRTEALIRPILRGRDIKRYGYEWAGQWVIALCPSQHYNIEDYPSVKDWLINGAWVLERTKAVPTGSPLGSGKERLAQEGTTKTVGGITFKTRKRTANKWFETSDSIAYLGDFGKGKIVYSETNDAFHTKICFEEKGEYLTDKTCFILSGDDSEVLRYTYAILSSYIFTKYMYFTTSLLGEKGIMLTKENVVKFPLPPYVGSALQQEIVGCNDMEHIDALVCDLYDLNGKEREYILGL